MKFKTTQKAVKENYNTIIKVPYCALQYLLRYESTIAYTERREGEAADIYDVGEGTAIATGYAPFGNIRPDYDLCKRYENQAEQIFANYSIEWEERREKLYKLRRQFIDEVTQKQ